MLSEKADGKMAKWRAEQKQALGRIDGSPAGAPGTHEGKTAKARRGGVVKDGAQRKREHDQRKRKQGLREFRAWCTEEEAKQLRAALAKIRVDK